MKPAPEGLMRRTKRQLLQVFFIYREMDMRQSNVKNLVLTAMFIALGLLLPMAFHAFGLGKAFLPLHIPVLLCGLICGPFFGAICGFVTPLLSSLFTGMPVLFPTGVTMMAELCVYGILTGFLYRRKKWNIYPALIVSMLGGRAVSGLMNALLLGLSGTPYGMGIFLTNAFVTALPGIVLQIVAIPLLVMLLERARLIPSPRITPTPKKAAGSA